MPVERYFTPFWLRTLQFCLYESCKNLFFRVIRIRISDPRSLRSWYIKETDESTLVVFSSARLMHHDQNDHGSLFLIQITPKERTLSREGMKGGRGSGNFVSNNCSLLIHCAKKLITSWQSLTKMEPQRLMPSRAFLKISSVFFFATLKLLRDFFGHWLIDIIGMSWSGHLVVIQKAIYFKTKSGYESVLLVGYITIIIPWARVGYEVIK